MAGFVESFAGGIVGGGVVRLFLDAKQYYEGLAKADAQGKTATGNMGVGMSKFGMIATAVFATAALAAVKFGADAVKAAEAHEIALQKLEVAAKGNAQAFADLAVKEVQLTGYTQDSILAAEANLAVLHLTTAQMETLLPLVADFARFTGVDLVTAAGNIERAFQGNTRALKAVGITYKVTGDHAKTFADITAALAGQIGGTASAYLTTTAGQLSLLGARYDELKIKVGQGLTPVLGSLVQTASALMPVFQAVGFILLTIVGAFRLIVAAVQDTTAIFRDLANTFLEFIGVGHQAGQAIDHLGQAQRANTTMLQQYLSSTQVATGATGAFAATQQKAAQTASQVAAALVKEKNAQDQLAGGLVGLIAQRQQLQKDEQALAAGATGTTNIHDLQLKVLQDQVSLTAATKQYRQTLHDSGDTQRQAVAMLEAQGRAAGLAKKAVDALAGSYLNMFGTINAGQGGVADAIRRELTLKGIR